MPCKRDAERNINMVQVKMQRFYCVTYLKKSVTKVICKSSFINDILFRNGRPLERSSRIKRHFDGTTARIEISKVKASDAGEYTCVATNILGSMRNSCQVSKSYIKRKLIICHQFLIIFFKIFYYIISLIKNI